MCTDCIDSLCAVHVRCVGQVLSTLPQREFVNGMAEVVKAAAIRDEALFHELHVRADAVLRQDGDILLEVITRAVRIKADVVALDEREAGLRAVLNCGHTVGHAIEAALQPAWLHGECVSVGMVVEVEAARAMGVCDAHTVARLLSCLHAYGLPVKVPPELQRRRGYLDTLTQYLLADKKNTSASTAAAAVKCALLSRVGAACGPPYTQSVQLSLILRLLSKAVLVHPMAALPTAGRASSAGTRVFRIRTPGSKSLSNRVLLLASLCKDPVRIVGLLQSDDTQVMLAFLARVGVGLHWDGAALTVTGTGGVFQAPTSPEPVYLGNAGTAARFITSLCCLLPQRCVAWRGIASGCCF